MPGKYSKSRDSRPYAEGSELIISLSLRGDTGFSRKMLNPARKTETVYIGHCRRAIRLVECIIIGYTLSGYRHVGANQTGIQF
jgi:hypothetical protein